MKYDQKVMLVYIGGLKQKQNPYDFIFLYELKNAKKDKLIFYFTFLSTISTIITTPSGNNTLI